MTNQVIDYLLNQTPLFIISVMGLTVAFMALILGVLSLLFVRKK